MSTAQPLSFEGYTFPQSRSSHPYDLSMALGASRSSSLYSHAHMDPSASGAHINPHIAIPSDSTYPYFLPDEHDHLATGHYYLGGLVDARNQYSFAHRPPSPRSLYSAPAAWSGLDRYGALYEPSSSAFMQNSHPMIDVTHTIQTQQAPNPQPAALQPSSRTSASPWTLSGSLDPSTGEFQRSVEHPRLRTAQACEKCRIRKAKCSGELPCKRCVSRGLQCEYAPERKMRGPNKQKRRNIMSTQKDTHTSPTPRERRASVASTASSFSDSQESDVSDASSYGMLSDTPSSAHSSPASANRPLPDLVGGRSRAATVGLRPGGSANTTGHVRPRPPPISLDAAREAFYPHVLAQMNAEHQQEAFAAEPVQVSDKHTSLPSYLLESYARIALHNKDDPSSEYAPQRMSQELDLGFMHVTPADAFSVYSRTSSNSSDMSAPMTPPPLSLSLSFDGSSSSDLLYPSGVGAEPTFDNGAFGDGSEMFGDAPLRPKSAQERYQEAAAQWLRAQQALQMDDATPRGGVNDAHKHMAHVGDML